MANENRQQAMLTALEKCLGVVTTACKEVGMPRSTHYKWMAEDEKYKAAVEDLANVTLDFAEAQLHKQIAAGEVASTIFYLKTKGKKRGFIERNEWAPVDPDGNALSSVMNINVVQPPKQAE